MAIIINFNVMLAKRKMSVTQLTEKVGITVANLSISKNGMVFHSFFCSFLHQTEKKMKLSN